MLTVVAGRVLFNHVSDSVYKVIRSTKCHHIDQLIGIPIMSILIDQHYAMNVCCIVISSVMNTRSVHTLRSKACEKRIILVLYITFDTALKT